MAGGSAGRPRRVAPVTRGYEQLAARLEHERRVIGYSDQGCRTHYLQAGEFLAWLETQNVFDVTAVTPENIRGFYAHTATRPSVNGSGALSENAIAGIVRVVRDLFAMLVAAGELASDPTSAVRWERSTGGEATERQRLTLAEVERLYAAATTTRERAILSLAYGCGLRVGEMVRLNVADVRLRDEFLVVQRGKGGKRRTVPLSEGVAEDLREYLHRDRAWWTQFAVAAPTPALVVGDQGERMQMWTFNKRLGELGARAGLTPKLTCHMLRHAIATHLLERGMAMQQVQLFLGHEHLETTQVYTHVSGAMLEGLIDE